MFTLFTDITSYYTTYCLKREGTFDGDSVVNTLVVEAFSCWLKARKNKPKVKGKNRLHAYLMREYRII